MQGAKIWNPKLCSTMEQIELQDARKWKQNSDRLNMLLGPTTFTLKMVEDKVTADEPLVAADEPLVADDEPLVATIKEPLVAMNPWSR